MTLPSQRTILLFTRAPEAEARAKQLPFVEGTRLFTGFLKGWRQRASDAGAELFVVTPESSKGTLARLLPDARIAVQEGASFADRIESAFAAAFHRGASSVLMVGGDSPPLDSIQIHQAFAHLEAHDRAFVLTPAEDGGVNAIGFAATAERCLGSITWQSSDVFRQLRAEAERLGLPLLLTAIGSDLDGASNVGALYRLSRLLSGWSTFRWLLLSLLSVARRMATPVAWTVSRLVGQACVTRGPPLSFSS